MTRIDFHSTDYHLQVHMSGYTREFLLQTLIGSDYCSRDHRNTHDNPFCRVDIKMSNSLIVCGRDFNVLVMKVVFIGKSDFRHHTGRHGHNILSQCS